MSRTAGKKTDTQRVLCVDVVEYISETYLRNAEKWTAPVDFITLERFLSGIDLAPYHAIVITDGFFLNERIKEPLQSFFQSGGTVVIIACDGVFAVPGILNDIFGCCWSFAAYTKRSFVVTKHYKTHFTPGKVSKLGYTKANMLGVPEGEAIFEVETGSAKYTPVAVHSGEAGGKLAYIGHVGFEEAFVALFEELCNPPRTDVGESTLFMVPSDIRFTQAAIKVEFQNGLSLEDTACQLAGRDIRKRDVPMIQIVLHTDGHFYSLDNRRLAVFRLLQLAGKISRIKVKAVPKDSAEWRRKFDEDCDHADSGSWMQDGHRVKLGLDQFSSGAHPRLDGRVAHTRMPCLCCFVIGRHG
ncbi:unnamed protein product [Polarella glacialis]|uniref:Uncharacterized protein n=1 Tax=Polarella glacialis TaxID=89957 RepID=A0A813G487_POLGL|nr:unnamed protein product [Polarella glacialis]